ncbi:MAG TPA: ABC transporter permease [Alphaproteobacteria bacterium]|nr:ABC transporter permease [Alphaproteobacteria bacterium]
MIHDTLKSGGLAVERLEPIPFSLEDLSALSLFTGLGMGLFIGAVAASLQQALLLGFFSVFPIMVISGTLVPVESMPRPIQLLSLLSPLRYYHEIGLGLFLKGVGMASLWRQALAMGALGVGILALRKMSHQARCSKCRNVLEPRVGRVSPSGGTTLASGA